MNVESLNEERKKRHISIAELAQKANLPKGTVEKILFGIVKHPRIDTMQAIEKALGINDTYDNTADITNKEEELLAIFREIGERYGESGQQNYIDIGKNILKINK